MILEFLGITTIASVTSGNRVVSAAVRAFPSLMKIDLASFDSMGVFYSM